MTCGQAAKILGDPAGQRQKWASRVRSTGGWRTERGSSPSSRRSRANDGRGQTGPVGQVRDPGSLVRRQPDLQKLATLTRFCAGHRECVTREDADPGAAVGTWAPAVRLR